MRSYRVHFVDHGDRKFATEHMLCRDDDHAREAVKHIDVPSIGAGYEVWDGERLVQRTRR